MIRAALNEIEKRAATALDGWSVRQQNAKKTRDDLAEIMLLATAPLDEIQQTGAIYSSGVSIALTHRSAGNQTATAGAIGSLLNTFAGWRPPGTDNLTIESVSAITPIEDDDRIGFTATLNFVLIWRPK